MILYLLIGKNCLVLAEILEADIDWMRRSLSLVMIETDSGNDISEQCRVWQSISRWLVSWKTKNVRQWKRGQPIS